MPRDCEVIDWKSILIYVIPAQAGIRVIAGEPKDEDGYRLSPV